MSVLKLSFGLHNFRHCFVCYIIDIKLPHIYHVTISINHPTPFIIICHDVIYFL